MSINIAVFTGRLTADPQLRQTSSTPSVSMCPFTVAVDGWREGEVTFIPCVAWRKTAEFVAKYFAKGSRIEVSGTIQQRTYTDRDGVGRSILEIEADRVSFGESRRERESRERCVEKPESSVYIAPSGAPSGFDTAIGGAIEDIDGELPF